MTLASVLDRNFLTAEWPWEWVCAKSIARDTRRDENSVLLTGKRKSELLGVCGSKPISSVSCSACAIVVVAWSIDA